MGCFTLRTSGVHLGSPSQDTGMLCSSLQRQTLTFSWMATWVSAVASPSWGCPGPPSAGSWLPFSPVQGAAAPSRMEAPGLAISPLGPTAQQSAAKHGGTWPSQSQTPCLALPGQCGSCSFLFPLRLLNLAKVAGGVISADGAWGGGFQGRECSCVRTQLWQLRLLEFPSFLGVTQLSFLPRKSMCPLGPSGHRLKLTWS